MHLDLLLIHLLFTEASLEMVCMKEASLQEGKQGEKAELCQMTQEVDRKSVATGLMEE